MVYIYGLKCPLAGVIRYVGKSQNPSQRLRGHLTGANTHAYKHHTSRWLRKLIRLGLEPELSILHEVQPEERWQDVERRFISEAKERGWDLTNSTAGGEGLDYLDPADAKRYRKNLSAAMKKVQSERPEILIRMREGGKRSWVDNKEARVAACMAGWTDESRIQHRATMAALNKTPEFKAAMSAGQKASWDRNRDAFLKVHLSPETIAKKSDAAKAGWADPKKRAAKLAGRWTPEAKAKQAQEVAGRRDKIKAAMTPEVRARQAATLKETWARRKAAMGRS